MKCRLIEIYDKRTNDTVIQFVANKKTDIQKQVINAMEKQGFNILLKGSITPNGSDLYWLASNKDYSNLHLTYREKNIEKKDLTFDSKGYSYVCFNKNLRPVDTICYNELTTFETRKLATDFYLRCMSCSEGSERDRYTNLYLGLTQTNDKMVHDGECEYYEQPTFYKVGKYNPIHDCIEDDFELPKTMKYTEYLEYKKELENKDLEVE